METTPDTTITRGTTPKLPAERAFVVHLRADADIWGGRIEGRVEHVCTRVHARFLSVGQLVEFFRRLERDVPRGEESDT